MNRRTFLKLSAASAVTALVGCYPVLIERNIVTINTYRIEVPGLPPSFNGYRIAHLTDIHYGPLVSQEFITGVVARTNKLGVDLIVCTGDYIRGRHGRQNIDIIWPMLMELRAKDGVMAVLGNHDHWADSGRSLSWLDRSGLGIRHTCRFINRGGERIAVGGAGDFWMDELEIDRAFYEAREEDCKILLAHNPDSLDTNFATRISLAISGHTHGGQVVLPFIGPPILPVTNKRYSSGIIETPRAPLFISRGIGWAIYPVRFNCYPEIALLELVRPNGQTT